MPYNSVEDLPVEIRRVLPPEAQAMYLKVFNAAYQGSCNQDDGCSARVAWAQVRQSFKPTSSGEYAPITNKKDRHDTLFNSLDRKVAGKWFSVPPFEATVNKWNGKPLILGNKHPDMMALIRDPVTELARIDGKIVGYHENMWVDKLGHPKLRGQMVFDETYQYGPDGRQVSADPVAVEEARRLHNEGKLSLSTGFFCPFDDEGRLQGVVTPNHTLLFEENWVGGDVPKDPGAFILNKYEGDEMDDAHTNAGMTISDQDAATLQSLGQRLIAIFSRKKEAGNPPAGAQPGVNTQKESDEMDKDAFTSAIAHANKEVVDAKTELATAQARVTELEAELAKKDEVITGLQNKETERQAALKEEAWGKVKETVLVPALTHKEEDEKALREEWDNDKDAFYLKYAGQMNKQSKTDGEEGDAHLNKEDDSEDDKDLKEANDFWDSI